MIVSYQGQDWPFDVDKITVDEWRELKRKYKMTPSGFEDSIMEADPDASTFAWWIMMRQSGQHSVPLGDHLKPDILALNQALNAAQKAELAAAGADAAQEPDPGPTTAAASPAPSPSLPAAPSLPPAPEGAATGS